MMSDFENVLDDCLSRLRSGESLEECLSAYPFHAEALRPLLMVSIRLREIPMPRARLEAIQHGRERILATFNSHRTYRLPTLVEMRLAFRWAVALALVVFVMGILTIRTSAGSLPGDSMYGIKRGWEKVRLSLTTNEQDRYQLYEQYDKERLVEIQTLIRLHRSELVEFEARLDGISAEEWKLDGLVVRVNSETEVQGSPQIGMVLEIVAQVQNDGTLRALSILVEEMEKPDFYPISTPQPDFEKKEPLETTEGLGPSTEPVEESETTEESTPNRELDEEDQELDEKDRDVDEEEKPSHGNEDPTEEDRELEHREGLLYSNFGGTHGVSNSE